MTTVPVLMTTGHRLLGALLTEAKVALADDDWPDVMECLEEFETRVEKHMQAEEEVLFPTLALLNPAVEDELARCREEHRQLTLRMRELMACASSHDKPSCKEALNRMIELLSCHCVSEERFTYALARGVADSTVRELAGKLGPEEDDPILRQTRERRPPSYRLH